jgi:hypothetical protein
MSTKLEFFHPSRIALNLEVKNHSGLLELLAQYEQDDFIGKLGEIAAYCNIALDGVYSQGDLDKLCDILCGKLRKKRSIIIH